MAVKLVIVGGVAGGATAAARARRVDESAEIVLFERGEFVSFANCGLPYYIGDTIKNRDNLFVATPSLFKHRFNIDVRTMSEVTGIDREKKEAAVRNLATGETYHEKYDKMILSPGAAPVKPPIPGIELDAIFTLRNIPDTDSIKEYVDSAGPKSAVIVGGGYIGLEMAENLAARGLKVTVIEMLNQVLPPFDFEMAAIVHEHLIAKGIELRLGEKVKTFRKENGKISVSTSGGREIDADMAVLSIGVRPEIELARKAGLEIGKLGGILTDDTMRTSDPDIFAVGDAVEVKDFISGDQSLIPLAGPANKQGRIAADNALGRHSIYRGTQGTAILKIFDLAAACTGNNEKSLDRRGIPYLTSHTHSGAHAGYYPVAKMMAIKLLFSPQDGVILGAQIVGGDGVDKRIDVIATAIRAGMTVFDLEELELAYAPPYSSAKDPVNMAGFAAANILKGDSDSVTWKDIEKLDPEKYALLDVRNKTEIEALGGIEGAIHIPLNELRNRLPELDKSKIHVVYCAVGLRGYIAHRILSQHGFKSANLSGGYTTFKTAKKNTQETTKET